MSSARRYKIKKVMTEPKESNAVLKVKSPKQAVATAMSKAGVSKLKPKKKK